MGISFRIGVGDIRRMFIERLAERTGVQRDVVEAELRAEETRCRSQGDGLDLRAVVRRVKLLSGGDILS